MKNFFLFMSLMIVMLWVSLVVIKDTVIENASRICDYQNKCLKTLAANLFLIITIIYGSLWTYQFVNFFGAVIALELAVICFLLLTLIISLSTNFIEANLN